MTMVDWEIENAIKDGAIVIEPFNKQQLSVVSYDVRIGRWYWPVQNSDGLINRAMFPSLPSDARGQGGKIKIKAGARVLAHTMESIGGCVSDDGQYAVTAHMSAKSTTGRYGITACLCAGFGDVGYTRIWVMEVLNANPFDVEIDEGQVIAQIIFTKTKVPSSQYGEGGGRYAKPKQIDDYEKYNPFSMLPRVDWQSSPESHALRALDALYTERREKHMQNMPTKNENSKPVAPILKAHPSVSNAIASKIDERTQKGIATYGQPLCSHNGRDAQKDLEEELLDALQYATQCFEEGTLDEAHYDEIVDEVTSWIEGEFSAPSNQSDDEGHSVFMVPGRNEVERAVVMARNSRSPAPLGEIYAEMRKNGGFKPFIATWLDAYGHESVREGAGVPAMQVEGFSDLLICTVQGMSPLASWLQASTRYLRLAASTVHHNSGPDGDARAAMWMERYQYVTSEMEKHTSNRTRVFDAARMLLPAGVGSRTGVRADARAWSSLLRKMRGLKGELGKEAAKMADMFSSSFDSSPYGYMIGKHRQPESYELDFADDVSPSVPMQIFGKITRNVEREIIKWRLGGWKAYDPMNIPSPTVVGIFETDFGGARDAWRQRTFQWSRCLPVLRNPRDVNPFWAMPERIPESLQSYVVKAEEFGDDPYLNPMCTPVTLEYSVPLFKLLYTLRLRTWWKVCHPSYAKPFCDMMTSLYSVDPALCKLAGIVKVGGIVDFEDRVGLNSRGL